MGEGETAGSGSGFGAGKPADAAQAVARATGAWGRGPGLAGVALGVVAAGVAAERLTVHRAVRRKARLALDAAGPYGTLRGDPGTVRADDGTELYYEIDEFDESAGDGGSGAAGRAPTVVFTHGYCLHQDAWHFQRAALRAATGRGADAPSAAAPLPVRAVYWDQRSHGRSARAAVGEPVSVDRLGRDLRAVLDAAVPEGPVILVGHSMGGMTMMALADQYPDYVAERVAGTAFVDTSAGGLSETTYGLPLPAVGVRAVRRAIPGVLRALVSRADLVERGRRAAGDLFAALVRRYAFGSAREVDPAVARFAERLLESVPIDVVAEFYPAFEAHEKVDALAAYAGRPVLVLAGENDLLTPPDHSEAIAAALPGARLVLLERTGHLSLLERPDAVNEELAALIARSAGAVS